MLVYEGNNVEFGPPGKLRLPEWESSLFLRSKKPIRTHPKTKGTGFDFVYAAACKSCRETFQARKDNLQNHVETCEAIDEDLKKQFKKTQRDGDAFFKYSA